MNYSVRFAGPTDAALVHRFICDLAAFQNMSDSVQVSPAHLENQMNDSKPPFECLLVEKDQEAVGFALFHPTYSTFTGKEGMHLVDLFIQPAFRQNGVGKKLFSQLLDIARKRNYARIDWEVLKSNQSAQRFYESLGARYLDEWLPWRLEPA